MKAIVQEGYGSADALKLREIETPAAGDDGILVEVHAASVNALDWHVARGVPFFIPLLEAIGAPKHRVRGVDLAGRVTAVGKNVTRFKLGDEVLGGADGSFAEFTVTTEKRLALKPAGITFEQAATLHVAGLTALQGLRDRAQVRAGQRVLVNGAGGGVGTFAVQIAKWLGAHVTAVTRAGSVDLVRSIGVDEVIDHDAEDFTSRPDRWDVIFDIGGNRPFSRCRRVMEPDGILLAIGGPAGRWIAPAGRLFGALMLSPLTRRRRVVPFVAKSDPDGLALLAELVERGTMTPVIDRRFALSETAEAVRHLGAGHMRGKVVINTR
ncbi:MAG: NAD(P)-dependent alcohol dehydrogenase [Verrucomicrobiaceae bacterium]|nr:NAD(P)-dependent alcohol dehydrogenase [Verrucomicrobiaceae bacterium]